jgi:hypothetical protein
VRYLGRVIGGAPELFSDPFRGGLAGGDPGHADGLGQFGGCAAIQDDRHGAGVILQDRPVTLGDDGDVPPVPELTAEIIKRYVFLAGTGAHDVPCTERRTTMIFPVTVSISSTEPMGCRDGHQKHHEPSGAVWQ